MNLPLSVAVAAGQAFENLKLLNMTEGRKPSTLAAVAAQMVLEESDIPNFSMKELEETFEVSRANLKRVYKLLLEYKDQIVPPQFALRKKHWLQYEEC